MVPLVIIEGKLNAASSMGFRNVSFFRESIQSPIPETHRYYNAPDNINKNRFGESVFPIKAAFCFETGLKNHVNVTAQYRNKPGFDAASGLVKKGSSEYLFPGEVRLDNINLWGIRVPKLEKDSKESYNRLIATMYLRNIQNIRIAHGSNDFYNAHSKFYLVMDRLAGLVPNINFTFNKNILQDINVRLQGM